MKFLFSFHLAPTRAGILLLLLLEWERAGSKTYCWVLPGDLTGEVSPPHPLRMKRRDTLKYCLSACIEVLLTRRWEDNLISIPRFCKQTQPVRLMRMWEWHPSKEHSVLMIQVGKGNSFRWSSHLLLHLPGFHLPFVSETVLPRRTAAITEMLSCITQALKFAQFLSGALLWTKIQY